MTRFTHRLLFIGIVAFVLSAGVNALASTSRATESRPAPSTGDVLAAPHHADGAIVTARPRPPFAGSAAVLTASRITPIFAATSGTRPGTPYGRTAPLYTLLRVYRL